MYFHALKKRSGGVDSHICIFNSMAYHNNCMVQAVFGP